MAHRFRTFLLLLILGSLSSAGILSCNATSTSSSPNPNTANNGNPGGNTGVNAHPPALGANCSVFPGDNPWNRDVSADPVDANSDDYIAFIQSHGGDFLHPDFGSNPDYGIPYAIVNGDQAKVPIAFTDFGEQSDPGPYPIPPNAPVEAGSDAHVLVVDQQSCMLYEMYVAEYVGPGWQCASGAVFDLKSNGLRPDYWTSADAAGLPIFPGLVRYDEAVELGEIRHALRFTVDVTQRAFIHPATHFASDETNADAPPMGLRLRLKTSYDISGFTGTSRVVLEALKKYGMIVADNGGNWFISGSTDSRWDDENLEQLKSVPGTAFEVVQSGAIVY